MAQVAVNIAGRQYRMACEDGQEPHLEELARVFDSRITEMRGAFGEIGDQRLMVMAAISLADDRGEAQRRAANAEPELAKLREAIAAAQATNDDLAARLARAVDETATRIERVAKKLEGG